MGKVAFRTANPKRILAFGADITKETAPVAHLRVVQPDGGSRMVAYADFEDLSSGGVSLAIYNGAAPSPFKADKSHTWDGSAPVATDYVFPPPEVPEATPLRLDKADFNELCYAALGHLAAPNGSDADKYAAGLGAFQQALEGAAAHESATVRGAARHFNDVMAFVKPKVEMFFGVLVGAEIITPIQAGAVLAIWPTE